MRARKGMDSGKRGGEEDLRVGEGKLYSEYIA